MQEAVIIDCLRTPVGKAPRGALRNTRPDETGAVVVRRLLEKYPQVAPADIEDVILGCAMPEAESGNNMARIVAQRAGLPDTVTGLTINRFCSSGLQSIALAADRIRSGGAEIMLAGGSESMSMIPMGGNKLAPNPWLVDHRPEVYMNMGLTAETAPAALQHLARRAGRLRAPQPSERAAGAGGRQVRRRDRAGREVLEGRRPARRYDPEALWPNSSRCFMLKAR